jgi:hypothetical protein
VAYSPGDRFVAEDRPDHAGPVCATFPVADLHRATGHYTKLGFTVSPYEDGAEYAFAERDGVELHLSYTPDHDPRTGAACVYLYVQDAAELVREWRASGSGRTGQARDMDYGVREAVHVDPDNNMLKFGSFINPQ